MLGLHGGAFDFFQHPITPAGARVLIHENQTFEHHGHPTAFPDIIWVPQYSIIAAIVYGQLVTSKQTRITDTVAWFLEIMEVPGATAHDLFLAAKRDLTASLQALIRSPTALMHSTQPSHQLSDF